MIEVFVQQISTMGKDEWHLQIRFHSDVKQGAVIQDRVSKKKYVVLKVDWEPMFGNSQLLRARLVV